MHACVVQCGHQLYPVAGSGPATRRAWGKITRFGRYAPDPQLRSKLCSSKALVSRSAEELITQGLGVESWARIASWLEKYEQFLQRCARDAGFYGLEPEDFADNTLALNFLAAVNEEGRGHTRVNAACRAIEFLRSLLKISPLGDDPRVAFLKRGVKRRNSKGTKRGPTTPGGYADCGCETLGSLAYVVEADGRVHPPSRLPDAPSRWGTTVRTTQGGNVGTGICRTHGPPFDPRGLRRRLTSVAIKKDETIDAVVGSTTKGHCSRHAAWPCPLGTEDGGLGRLPVSCT